MTQRTEQDFAIIRSINASIKRNDVADVMKLLRAHSPLIHHKSSVYGSFIDSAANSGSLDVAKALIALGIDVNQMEPKGSNALGTAVREGRLEFVEWLLKHGADPNLDRNIFTAIRLADEDVGLAITKLLVDGGADVNRVYDVYGSADVTLTNLEFALAQGKQKIAAYLRSAGAKHRTAQDTGAGANVGDEIVAHFEKQFGPVLRQSINEVVPGVLPLSIHVIKPTKHRRQLTLFTSGMSHQAMSVPLVDGFDSSEYRYAEVLVHLPGDWPLDMQTLRKPEYGWPICWLRKIAKYPFEHQTWLGGPVTVIAEADPPTPLWPHSKFVAMLLFASSEMTTSDGRKVQFYTMTPIDRAEYDLERREDVTALFRAFDEAGIEQEYVADRPSAVSDS